MHDETTPQQRPELAGWPPLCPADVLEIEFRGERVRYEHLRADLDDLKVRVDRLEQQPVSPTRVSDLEVRVERLESELTTARQLLAVARERGFAL